MPESRVAVVNAEDITPDIMVIHALVSQPIRVDDTVVTPSLKVSMVDQEGGVSFTTFGTSPIIAVVKKKKRNKEARTTTQRGFSSN